MFEMIELYFTNFIEPDNGHEIESETSFSLLKLKEPLSHAILRRKRNL
jgi:hypothetical protein